MKKQRPLTEHAQRIYDRLMNGEVLPKCEVNPGVVNRLMKEPEVEIFFQQSHYPTHRGRKHEIAYLRKKIENESA